MSTWIIDSSHSTIGFKVKHLMVSTVRGRFNDFEGSITAPDDRFNGATAALTIQTSSIDTNNEQRDNHLRSADFFEAEQFPTIMFVSTSCLLAGDHLEVVGNMTMHGITKSVVLTAVLNGIGQNTDGTRFVSFDISGKINRQDFGVKWSAAIEAGGVVVSDEVVFDIHIEAKEQ